MDIQSMKNFIHVHAAALAGLHPAIRSDQALAHVLAAPFVVGLGLGTRAVYLAADRVAAVGHQVGLDGNDIRGFQVGIGVFAGLALSGGWGSWGDGLNGIGQGLIGVGCVGLWGFGGRRRFGLAVNIEPIRSQNLQLPDTRLRNLGIPLRYGAGRDGQQVSQGCRAPSPLDCVLCLHAFNLAH